MFDISLSIHLEQLIRPEQERNSFIVKVSRALRLQLESFFSIVSDLANQAEKGHNLPTAQINQIFLDFSEVMQTIDSIEQIVTTPSKKVASAINRMEYHVASLLSKSPTKPFSQISRANTPSSPLTPSATALNGTTKIIFNSSHFGIHPLIPDNRTSFVSLDASVGELSVADISGENLLNINGQSSIRVMVSSDIGIQTDLGFNLTAATSPATVGAKHSSKLSPTNASSSP